jgi:ribose 1,5-bisphosphokinase
MARGTLHLVVGPSGVGKDTLLDGARAALADDPRFVFARRHITRAAEAGGEDHLALDEAAFEAVERTGGHLLSWRAHGLRYGLPAALEDDLADGRHVVANVSRAVLDEARARLAPVSVLSVSAPDSVVRARLTARGRETPAEIEDRLARAAAYQVEGADVTPIVNDGGVADGVAALLRALGATADAEG